ncbi:MAG: endonuclease/exonuclease/phosphatase family protein [Brachymonas sp.]|nr:endonuclease/exonuclease/phosphatase family protein [Brachymonas sp.]
MSDAAIELPDEGDLPSPTEIRSADTLRVVTYNIHKGVQGVWPAQRLEIHNLQQAIASLQADVVCLQEVRKLNRKAERKFTNWPTQSQAEYLAPEGYHSVYVTNAITTDGEHGNALLSRWPVVQHQHEDISDHRFEQRGLLHSILDIQGRHVHVIVVHLGLIGASRVRQVHLLRQFIRREIPDDAPLLVAGDFNDWNQKLHDMMAMADLYAECDAPGCLTYPSRLPLTQLDHVYARGLLRTKQFVPRREQLAQHVGVQRWSRLSDHLPLVVEFALK